ncbi:hypothetical protein P7K49_026081 [Saguinus oedipus]|uniref:Uncharacterized protein n=1 Tax=Saguinus oedipus TaxID=9490 RepID=A0ABQ9UJ14_SAGOE|nr:hypothetical protein P7K49_026081 [Saguinus oedipus]
MQWRYGTASTSDGSTSTWREFYKMNPGLAGGSTDHPVLGATGFLSHHTGQGLNPMTVPPPGRHRAGHSVDVDSPQPRFHELPLHGGTSSQGSVESPLAGHKQASQKVACRDARRVVGEGGHTIPQAGQATAAFRRCVPSVIVQRPLAERLGENISPSVRAEGSSSSVTSSPGERCTALFLPRAMRGTGPEQPRKLSDSHGFESRPLSALSAGSRFGEKLVSETTGESPPAAHRSLGLLCFFELTSLSVTWPRPRPSHMETPG